MHQIFVKINFTLFFVVGIGLLLNGCSRSSSPKKSTGRGEYIVRNHNEKLLHIDAAEPKQRMTYPWENGQFATIPKITKDFFRCQGSSLHPAKIVHKNDELSYVYDCGGYQRHSLPLRNGKEFIYPILIDLLNDLQKKTEKKVVITSGHSCPDHYRYVDTEGQCNSKHLLGAEVDFYLQGMEESPEKIAELIFAYYREQTKYHNLTEYQVFKKEEKIENRNVDTAWYNKEIYLKIVKKNEGRDLDNRHPYPYLCVKVRFDWDLHEPVTYSWEKAFHHIHRW